MKITIRNAVCGALAVALGVLTVAGLSAPLLSIGRGGSENGFVLMDLMSPYFFSTGQIDYRLMTAIIGLLCNFQCALGGLLLVTGLFSVIYDGLRGYVKKLAVACLVFHMLYAVSGFVYLIVFLNARDIDAYTLAYLPGIFALLVFIALFICSAKVSEKTILSARLTVERPPVSEETGESVASGKAAAELPAAAAGESEEQKIRYLKEYAQLYRDGIIDERELAAAKKRLGVSEGEGGTEA